MARCAICDRTKTLNGAPVKIKHKELGACAACCGYMYRHASKIVTHGIKAWHEYRKRYIELPTVRAEILYDDGWIDDAVEAKKQKAARQVRASKRRYGT